MPLVREAVRVRMAIVVTSDNLDELNRLLSEGWEVTSETPSDFGVLVILERDDYGPLLKLN